MQINSVAIVYTVKINQIKTRRQNRGGIIVASMGTFIPSNIHVAWGFNPTSREKRQ